MCVAYLYFPEASQRIHAVNPDCKIIIVLRHPVDRAFSNYLHSVVDGYEPLSFVKAIDAIPDRLAANWWWGFDYVGASLYSGQVRRYMDLFGRDNTHVFLFEDMAGREADFTADVLRALDLPPVTDIDTRPRRPESPPVKTLWARALRRLGGRPLADAVQISLRRRGKRLSPSLRASLYDRYFARDVEELESLLGRTFPAWRQ